MADIPQMPPEIGQTPSVVLEKKSAGPIIGIIIILIVLVLGGLLIYGKSIKNSVRPTVPPAPAVNTTAAQLQKINSQSTSDSVEDISSDLEVVSPDNLEGG